MVEPSLGSWLKVWLCDLDACIICGNEWSKTVDERCSVQMRVFVAQEGQLASRGLAPGLPFFTQALHEGTLEHVCTLTDLALAVSCIALLLLGYVLVLVIGCDCACACGCACAVLCCAVLCCAVPVLCCNCADTSALGHRAVCGSGESTDSKRGSVQGSPCFRK